MRMKMKMKMEKRTVRVFCAHERPTRRLDLGLGLDLVSSFVEVEEPSPGGRTPLCRCGSAAIQRFFPLTRLSRPRQTNFTHVALTMLIGSIEDRLIFPL